MNTESPKKTLSEDDKQAIKNAVLEAVAHNTSLLPDELAKAACAAINFIQDY